jgi:hypothetical protein
VRALLIALHYRQSGKHVKGVRQRQSNRIVIVGKEAFQSEIPIEVGSESGSFYRRFLRSSSFGQAEGDPSEDGHVNVIY